MFQFWPSLFGCMEIKFFRRVLEFMVSFYVFRLLFGFFSSLFRFLHSIFYLNYILGDSFSAINRNHALFVLKTQPWFFVGFFFLNRFFFGHFVNVSAEQMLPMTTSSMAPERPHSNTSLSSSDSAPGSIVSSSRSSSRDPLPALGPTAPPPAAVAAAAAAAAAAQPPAAGGGVGPPAQYNGGPPTAKPPYGLHGAGAASPADASKTSPTFRCDCLRFSFVCCCVLEVFPFEDY